MGWALAGKLALGALPMLFKGKKPDHGRVIREFLGARPEGYLSGEDVAFGERERSRGSESIGQGLAEARAMAARRAAARGIVGPAAEQSISDIEQGGAVARTGLSRNISDLLARIREGNKGWERQKLTTAFGAQIGEQNRLASQQSTFWNSQLQNLPLLFGAGSRQGGGGPAATATSGGFGNWLGDTPELEYDMPV